MPTYNGNNGSNTINGSSGDDIINGNGGNDTLDGLGGHDTINGGTGNDHIEGGIGNDVIHGNDDHDDIWGESGNDTLYGDSGNDEIWGGDNDDAIDGGSGNDELDGGNHNDTISGGTGDDDIIGGSGNDILHGNDNEDEISGGTGNDTMTGDAGNDELDGGDNDDNLDGGSGNDVLAGGNHNDTVAGGTGDDQIDGGSGNDILHGNGDDDQITGGTGTDTITGDDGNDVLDGGDQDDNLNGGAGNDILNGDDGNDTLTGGGGYDLLYGGFGTDTAVYSGSVLDYDFFIFGPLVTVSHDGGAGADGTDLLLSVEKLQFSDVTIDLTQNNAPIAFDDSASTNENAGSYSSGAASVLDNDFDFEGDALTVTAFVMAGTYGTLTMNANGTYSYVLNANAQTLAQGQIGQDSFNYTVSDGSLTDTGTLTISITGINDAPVAAADSASTSENATITYDVLGNDTDVDNGAVLTVTSATAPPGQGTASVVGNQVQWNPGTAFDHLNVGQSQVVVVSYTIQDQFGATSSSTLSITVTGTNDGPVANADTANAGENQTITVDVLVNDSDVDDGAVLTVTAASAPPGQGTASVVGNQVQWSPGSDFDHLALGATANVVVNYSIQDEHGATSSSTLTITVTGTNDGPVANADTANAGENQVILVDVLTNDTDVDDGAVLTVTAASAPPGQGTASVVGNQVQWSPGTDFDHLALGATANVVVNYSIQDQFGATSSSTLTITVTGTNDGPVANPDSAGAGENQVILVNVLTNDTDVDDGAVLTVTAASAPPGQGTASVVGNQVQFDPGGDFDYLAVGESVVVVLNYSIQDQHGAPSSSTVSVTVTGANDAPTIDAGGTDASGSVTELPNNDPNENAFTHSDSGTIAFDDVDLSDTHSASFTPQGGGYVGTFSLDPVNQAGDTVGWDFSVDDSAIDFLGAGDTLTQTYTVEIDDGHGGTVTQDVTITITGAADASPPDGTNWYIDNTAVGSTQDGSADNPYLSIAAFNAAQGTPTGPGANDNVFLLAGTGTYAEPDGINLLDGQTLTGVAAGPLRPTIVTTGGTNHGIELAQNNNVSGVDIGNTTGAGISDGGGTVGTLTISDVAKSGSGQIADIDQGGTLNVTLNSAASTGSSGGAIDLAGVGGSFAVTGATSITGIHAGGGIDITGSSLSASFAGGGTVSTFGTTAVNYVGNSGALALGGGLDIATTAGAGLNASGGGSLTFTGAGNSVTSTTGTAVSISGTTIGGAGVTLESVSSNGAASGIVLSGTGAGGFTVTGTGAAGSGGAILASTGAGVSLTNSGPVSLTDFAVSNGGDDGVRGSGVNGLDLVRVTVSNNGNGAGEHGLDMTGLTGIVGIDGSFFTGNAVDNIHILNTSGTLDLTMTGSTVGNSLGALANDGLIIEANGSALVRASVTGSTFVDNKGDAFQFVTDIAATSTSHVTFSNNDLTTTNAAVLGGGITISNAGASDLFYAVQDNDIQGARSTAISTSLQASVVGGEQHGTITGNTIGTTGVLGSGSQTGNGINTTLNGNGMMTVVISDNEVRQWQSIGINLLARDGSGRMNATIEDNVIKDPNTAGALNSIRVEAGAVSTDSNQIYLEMNDNDANTALALDIRLRVQRDADILMPGYGGAPTDTAAVDAFMTGKNPLGGDVTVLTLALNPGSGYFDTPGSAPVPLAIMPDMPLI